jgi:hypothetical protein
VESQGDAFEVFEKETSEKNVHVEQKSIENIIIEYMPVLWIGQLLL